jgi:hypothetical protein
MYLPVRIVRCLAFLLMLGLGTSLASDGWVVRDDGVGRVKIGMSLPQLNAALHERCVLPKEKDDQACFYVKPAEQPARVRHD